MIEKIAKSSAFLVTAAAGCYLGLVASRLLWYLPVLAAGLFSQGATYRESPSGAVPRLWATAPSDGPWLVFAVFAAGPIVVACLALAAGPAVASRLKGWSRLIFTFTLFWLAVLLGESVPRLVQRGWGPLGSAAQAMGISWVGSYRMDILLLSLLAGLLAIFSLHRAAAHLGAGPDTTMRLKLFRLTLWFALPVLILNALPYELGLSSLRFAYLGFPYAPSLLAVVVVSLAALRPLRSAPVFRPGLTGASVTILFAGLAFPALISYEENYRGLPVASKPFTPEVQSTAHWVIHFEKGKLSPEERTEWGAAADRRLEQFAERLGVDPWGKIADPRGEALLLMSELWGEAASPAIAKAVARYGIGTFHSHDLEAYARRLVCEERAFPLADVLRIHGNYLSPLVRDVLGGAWIESLVQQQGPAILPRLYRSGLQPGSRSPLAAAAGRSWDELEREWQAWFAASPECDEVLTA